VVGRHGFPIDGYPALKIARASWELRRYLGHFGVGWVSR
jgi:hypothetical protein